MDRQEKQTRVEEQTRIRHQLLENGYTPIPNKDKRTYLKRWTEVEVDHDVIDEWSDRLSWLATGLRIDGDLLALDFDIDDGEMLDAIWDAIEAHSEGLVEKLDAMPLRGGRGDKICLFCRLETGKIEKVWSKAFYNPAELSADPSSAVLHRLEVFSGQTRGRQVGVYGPHTVDSDGEEVVSYRWADGFGLADVRREDLPALRRKDVFTIVDIVSKELAKAGWEYEVASREGKITEIRSYTLTPDMAFVTNVGEVVGLDDLENMAGDAGLRVSLSFAEGASAANVTRGLVAVNPADDRVQIWDSATDTLYRPAEMDLRVVTADLGARLRSRGLVAPDRLPVLRNELADDAHAGEGEGESESESADDGLQSVLVDGDGRRAVSVDEGELTEATWAIAEWLAGSPDLYRVAGQVSLVTDDDAIVRMGDARLAVEIGSRVCCTREVKKGKSVAVEEVDPPAVLVRQVGSVVDEARFRDLRGVVDMPVMRADGGLVGDNGWDRETGLLVRGSRRFEGMIPDRPSREDALGALTVLMKPFREFKLVGPESWGALLAALLTAAVRPALGTAPAFALDAPTPGSGKTKMGECLMALHGKGALHAPLNMHNEEEISKVLLSVLLDKPGAVLFDNQVGRMDSASLAAVLTSPRYFGRKLGGSDTIHADTNILMLFSGNNMAVVGDMNRRVLPIRIDPECEAPAARQFDFDPLEEVRTNRDAMLAAAFTLIRWAVPMRRRGRIGSFDGWDIAVAQTVAALGLDAYMDPAKVLQVTQEVDPRAEETAGFMEGLRGLFGGDWFMAKDVAEAIKLQVSGSREVADVLEGHLRILNAVTIGTFMRYRKDTRAHGLVLQQMASSNKKSRGSRFRVKSEADSSDSVVEMGSWKARKERAKDKIEHLKKDD